MYKRQTRYTYEHYFDGSLPVEFMREYRKLMVLCDSPGDVARNANVEKMNIDYMPKECIQPLKEELSHIPDLVYSAGFDGNMEITAKGADKGKALQWPVSYTHLDVYKRQHRIHSYRKRRGNTPWQSGQCN